MERKGEEGSSQRRPLRRVSKIMVDAGGERVAGDGLYVQDEPEKPGSENAVPEVANTMPVADTAAQGKGNVVQGTIRELTRVGRQYQLYRHEEGMRRTARRRVMVVSNPDPTDESEGELGMKTRKCI